MRTPINQVRKMKLVAQVFEQVNHLRLNGQHPSGATCRFVAELDANSGSIARARAIPGKLVEWFLLNLVRITVVELWIKSDDSCNTVLHEYARAGV